MPFSIETIHQMVDENTNHEENDVWVCSEIGVVWSISSFHLLTALWLLTYQCDFLRPTLLWLASDTRSSCAGKVERVHSDISHERCQSWVDAQHFSYTKHELNRLGFSQASEEIPLHGSVSTNCSPRINCASSRTHCSVPGWPASLLAALAVYCSEEACQAAACFCSLPWLQQRGILWGRPPSALWGRLWRTLTSLWAPWLSDTECMCSPTLLGNCTSGPVIRCNTSTSFFCAFLIRKMDSRD